MTKRTPEQIQRYAENRRRKLASDPQALARDREVRRRSRERNRKEYNRKRRERYARDPEYRRSCLDSQRKPRVDKTRRTLNGKQVVTVTVTQAAAMLGVSRQAVDLWIKNHDVPTPLFKNPRLFTRTQVVLMQKLVEAGMKQEARMKARKLVYKHWNQ